jgi:ABC-2 type transport system permease protein
MVAAAAAATLVVALPLCVGSMVVAALLTGESTLIGASAVAAVVTVAGYTGVFVPLGAAVKRSFIIGLVYVLVWGGLLAKLGTGFASLSVESFGVSVIETMADIELSGGNLGLTASVVSALGFLVVGLAVATWQLGRREVD